MDKDDLVALSKRISYLLRHGARREGVSIDDHGWIDLDHLLDWLNYKPGSRATLDDVQIIVQGNDKQRFEIAGSKIRAVQGHSMAVDLELVPAEPPAILFHGTASRFVQAILEKGLLKMGRQHVHLSATIDQAMLVGKRHGSPVVFMIDAAAMHVDEFMFYRSKNGVWLVDEVPIKYLVLMA
jgi:putative RNA 2'-phosphotransferase